MWKYQEVEDPAEEPKTPEETPTPEIPDEGEYTAV